MRNLKRVLALAMAFALAFSVMSGAVVYSDTAESSDAGVVQASIDIMYQLGIMVGSGDTVAANAEFKPTETLSRAELTAVIFNLKNKGNANAPKASMFANIQMPFKDVPTDPSQAWYRGTLGYCYSNGLISGKTKTTFDPDGEVTTQELATVLLVALGYQPADLAKAWPQNVFKYSLEKGLLENVLADLNEGIPRQYVAVMVTNALAANPVKKTDGSYVGIVNNLAIRGASMKASTVLEDILSLFVPNEYDQLAYTLFAKTIHIYVDQRAFYAATPTTALTKSGKASAGKIKLDILRDRAAAYFDSYDYRASNVAFTAETALPVDNTVTPLGSLLNVSYYGMINYKATYTISGTGIYGGVSGSGPNPEVLYYRNYAVSVNVVGLKVDPISATSSENNNNKIYSNVANSTLKAGIRFDYIGNTNQKKPVQTYSFTGTEYDVITMKNVDNTGISGVLAPYGNLWISINNAAPTALPDTSSVTEDFQNTTYDLDGNGKVEADKDIASYIARTLRVNGDRPFDTIKTIVRNNAGNIVAIQKLQRKIGKVMEVTSDKVKLIVEGAAVELTKANVLNDDGTAFDFGAVRVLSKADGSLTTDEALYIAYYQDELYTVKEAGKTYDLGKFYAVKLTASRDKVAKNDNTDIYDASGKKINDYDPYVAPSEKIAIADTAAAVNLVGSTYDVIRGTAGKVLATFPIKLASSATVYNYGIILDTYGTGAELSPYQIKIMKTDGTSAWYPTDGNYAGHINKLVTFTMDGSKLKPTVVDDTAVDSKYYKDGIDAFVATSYSKSNNRITTCYDNNYFLNSDAVVFVKNGSDAWTVKSASAIVNDEDIDTHAHNSYVVYDKNTTNGYYYAKIWVLSDSEVDCFKAATSSVIVKAVADTNVGANVSYNGSKYTYTLKATGDGAKDYTKTFVSSDGSFVFTKGLYYVLTLDASGTVTAVANAPASGIADQTSITAYDTVNKKAIIGGTEYSIDGVKVVYYSDGADAGSDASTAAVDAVNPVGKHVGYAAVSGGKITTLFVDVD